MPNEDGHRLTGAETVELSRQYTFYSWSVQKDVKAIPAVGGKGVYYWDADGRRYLDFSSQLMSLNAGYQHPRIVAAIHEQADRLCAAHPNMATEPRGRLGRLLAEVTPGNLNKVFFTLGGAEANENAVKFARLYTGKSKIITRYRSYHGATYGAITLSGDRRRTAVEPGIPGVVHVFDPYCYRCVFGHTKETCHRECVTHIEETIRLENPDTVAALFLEGVTGSNGIFVPPDDYWPRLREITRKYGLLLIADEVMTGFGRTGEWFAVDHWQVEPDIITMAKGLTSSYLPLGAVVVSEPIARHFDDRYLYMGLTYSGHPLSCAAGVAAIKVYKEERLIENAKSLGRVLGGELERIKQAHSCVGDVRCIGLFSLLELVRDRAAKEPLDAATMSLIRDRLAAEGLTTFINQNWVFVCPPLVITREELLTGLRTIEKTLAVADALSRT
jgi:taurine---2-oxoglutarate transaminase